MKKWVYLLFVVGFVHAGLAQQPFVIEGYVPSLSDSTLLLLDRHEGRLLITVDTAYSVGGHFRFSYPLEQEIRMAVLGRSDQLSSMYLDIWAKPGITVNITGDNNLMYTWSVDSPVAEQQESEFYKHSHKSLWEEYQLYGIQRRRLQKQMSLEPSQQEKDKLRQQREELSELQDSLHILLYAKTLDLLSESEPSSVFVEKLGGVARMIFHYPEKYLQYKERTVEQYHRLTPELRGSEAGIELAILLFPPEQVKNGDAMADAQLPDLAGNLHKFSDFKGKYILLDFWSSGCGPCIMAMPELKELSQRYPEDLTIIGINSDGYTSWAQATERHAISWVNLHAPGQSEIAAKYGVNGIPHQVLISPEGIILHSWAGYGPGHIEKQLKKFVPNME